MPAACILYNQQFNTPSVYHYHLAKCTLLFSFFVYSSQCRNNKVSLTVALPSASTANTKTVHKKKSILPVYWSHKWCFLISKILPRRLSIRCRTNVMQLKCKLCSNEYGAIKLILSDIWQKKIASCLQINVINSQNPESYQCSLAPHWLYALT